MLKALYKSNFGVLQKTLNYSNPMQVPCVKAVYLNMGVGEAANDSKLIKSSLSDLSLISAQKAVSTFAKKSIAGFKIRKGSVVGCKVTVRGDRMYELLERVLYVALPRERDFLGFRRSQFDGRGNLSFSIKEHLSFLEIDYDKVDVVRGVNVTVVTNAVNDKDAAELFVMLGFPFIN